jgi:methyl-accepting chemotaxis protein
MSWKDLKIRSKIGSGFALMMAIVLILGIVIFYHLQSLEREIKELSDTHIPAVNEAGKLDRYWREVNEFSRSYDFTGKVYFRDRASQSYGKLNDAFTNLYDVLADQKEALTKKGIDLDDLKELLLEHEQFMKSYDVVQQESQQRRHGLSVRHKSLEAIRLKFKGYPTLQGLLAEYFSIANDVMSHFIERNTSQIVAVNQRLQSLTTKLSSNQLPGEAEQVLSEGIDGLLRFIDAETSARKLELKKFELAKAIMWETRTVADIGTDQIMAMGKRNSSIIKTQKNILLVGSIVVIVIWLMLVYTLARAISKPIENSILLAQKVAAGDLSLKYEVDRKDEVGQLLKALNSMVDNLKKIVADIAASSEEIERSSQQLNTEALELSEGATQQASSAEEVSSSMEEMYANIQQNSSNSRETEAIAQQAAEGISESHESTRTAALNMEEISEKISVISDIAFQTNILALNAAVEAARAAQDGRGFADVAAEVRKLAERSQTAAVEINKVSAKTLESSQWSLEKLNYLAPEIERTANLVKEITTASLEQVTGVEQINHALQQLNHVTQRNASHSDTIISAAKNLETLSQRLGRTIAVFSMDKQD